MENIKDEIITNESIEGVDVTNEIDEQIHAEMNSLMMDENYLKQQAQTQVNNYLAQLSADSVQTTIIETMIKAGITTDEKFRADVTNAITNGIELLKKSIISSITDIENVEVNDQTTMQKTVLGFMLQIADEALASTVTVIDESVETEQSEDNVITFPTQK